MANILRVGTNICYRNRNTEIKKTLQRNLFANKDGVEVEVMPGKKMELSSCHLETHK